MFMPYDKYQSLRRILPDAIITDPHICDHCEGVSTVT